MDRRNERRLVVCVRCGRTRPHAGRQLCETCRTHQAKRGLLTRWPHALTEARLHALHTGPVAARVAAYAAAREAGMTPVEAARRVGVRPSTAEKYERTLP